MQDRCGRGRARFSENSYEDSPGPYLLGPTQKMQGARPASKVTFNSFRAQRRGGKDVPTVSVVFKDAYKSSEAFGATAGASQGLSNELRDQEEQNAELTRTNVTSTRQGF